MVLLAREERAQEACQHPFPYSLPTDATRPANMRFVLITACILLIAGTEGKPSDAPPRFMATASSVAAMPPTCHTDRVTCMNDCREPDSGAHCKRDNTVQLLLLVPFSFISRLS